MTILKIGASFDIKEGVASAITAVTIAKRQFGYDTDVSKIKYHRAIDDALVSITGISGSGTPDTIMMWKTSSENAGDSVLQQSLLTGNSDCRVIDLVSDKMCALLRVVAGTDGADGGAAISCQGYSKEVVMDVTKAGTGYPLGYAEGTRYSRLYADTDIAIIPTLDTITSQGVVLGERTNIQSTGAETATVARVLKLTKKSTGTTTDNFGTGIEVYLQDATGSPSLAGSIDFSFVANSNPSPIVGQIDFWCSLFGTPTKVINVQPTGVIIFGTVALKAALFVTLPSTLDVENIYAVFNGKTSSKVAGYSTAVVNTTAKKIADATSTVQGSLLLVVGDHNDTDIFTDLLLVGYNATPTVISSRTDKGTPDARTYTCTSGVIRLALTTNTYKVGTLLIGTSGIY
jgi:hypothetical protein